jgi:hypothetical protein
MFRFTIRELVLIVALVAMALGWWLDRREAPRFEFSCRGEPQRFLPQFPITILEATCRNRHISDLQGEATVYVESTRDDGSVVRVKIDHFFLGPPQGTDEPPSVSFTTVRHLDILAEFYFARWDEEMQRLIGGGERYDRFHGNATVTPNKSQEVWTFVELNYVNDLKVRTTERFVMIYPARRPRPVRQEPDYDHVVDISKIKGADRHIDFPATVAKVNELLAQ